MFTFENEQQIIDRIKQPLNSVLIQRGIEIKRKHDLHVNGNPKELKEFIKRVVGIDDQQALEVRQELIKGKCGTVPIYALTLQPINKVFSARGSSRYYEFSKPSAEPVFKRILENIGLDLYLTNIWKKKVICDPMGITLIEISKDGQKAYPVYYSIESIKDIDYNSQFDINYIIFNAVNNKIRVIDSQTDYTFEEHRYNEYQLIKEETIQNYFGKVPAFFFSNKIDSQFDKVFTSEIADSLIIADVFLNDFSRNLVLKEFFVAQRWAYQTLCPVCSGTKVDKEGNDCKNCNGTGVGNYKKDLSALTLVKFGENESAQLPPFGYAMPPIEVLQEQNTTLENLKKQIIESCWGGESFKQSTGQKTAFEINVNSQSEQSKLNAFSENLENCESQITDYLGMFYFPSYYVNCSIHNGRQYLTKTGDEIIAAYNAAILNKAPNDILNNLYTEYLYTIYESNEQALNTELMKLWTKPFFHTNTADLLTIKLDIGKDYYKNLWYDLFVVNFEQSIPLYMATIDQVNNELSKFVDEKLKGINLTSPSNDIQGTKSVKEVSESTSNEETAID